MAIKTTKIHLFFMDLFNNKYIAVVKDRTQFLKQA
jgi:hypothetical protein